MNDNGGIIKFLGYNYTMKYYVGIKIIWQNKKIFKTQKQRMAYGKGKPVRLQWGNLADTPITKWKVMSPRT